MEWIKISKRVSYFNGPVNIGVVQGESGTILIDSGLDKQTAKKVWKFAKEQNWTIQHIINTHSHADHFGGNQFILNQNEHIEVWAPSLEEAIIRYPELEPIYLFNGVRPHQELMNKFLCANASKVDHVIHGEDVLVDGILFKILQLPGHSYGQIGLIVDDVCFAADSYFGVDVLKKHKIPYIIDACQTVESLQFLYATSYSAYIPGHGKWEEDAKETLISNIRLHQELMEQIFNIIQEKEQQGITTESIITAMMDKYKVSVNNMSQYLLFQTSLLAYMRCLWEMKKIGYQISEYRLLWFIAENA